jgi:hypothetical protein
MCTKVQFALKHSIKKCISTKAKNNTLLMTLGCVNWPKNIGLDTAWYCNDLFLRWAKINRLDSFFCSISRNSSLVYYFPISHFGENVYLVQVCSQNKCLPRCCSPINDTFADTAIFNTLNVSRKRKELINQSELSCLNFGLQKLFYF